jgi:hypothetical protein
MSTILCTSGSAHTSSQACAPTATKDILVRAARPLFAHSPLGYGMLVREPLDAALTRRWVEPCLSDAGVPRDTVAFLKGVDKRQLLDVSTRLHQFDKPVLLL